MGILNINDIMLLAQQGKGSCGTVLRIGNKDVLKVSPWRNTHIGSSSSPFHPLNVESVILKALVKNSNVVTLIDAWNIEGVLNRTLDKDEKATKSKVLRMKRARHGDVVKFLNGPIGKHLQNMDFFFKNMLFQVSFSLQEIFNVYPMFRHNDLKPSNVLLEKSSKLIWSTNGYTFDVPKSKYEVRLCDFHLSCIGGIIDNYETIDMNITYMSQSIGYKENQKADIFKFTATLYYLLHSELSDELKDILAQLFGGNLENDYYDNCFYAPNDIMDNIPSTMDILLCTDLFNHTKFDENMKTGRQSNNIELVMSGEIRQAPILLNATNLERDLGSEIYLGALSPRITYENISRQYSHIPSDILQIIPNLADDLQDKVISLSNAFLKDHVVPVQCSKIILIFAFVQVFRMSGLTEYGAEYLGIVDWIHKHKLNISPIGFAQIGIQWSWWNK
ncbi:hypothetical protein OAB94_02785 [Flavobacteriaceae bacterium]|nr:hypothetical protein [Flavobacteriaceae bacterium]